MNPSVRLLLHQVGERLRSLGRFVEDMDLITGLDRLNKNLQQAKVEYKNASVMVHRLKMATASFERFATAHGGEESRETEKMLLDFRELTQVASLQNEMLRDFINRQVTNLALEESTKSIELANSVKTITKLAFIFIPMTFGTSLCGANLSVMGSGTVPVWAMVTKVLAISILTFFFRDFYAGNLTRRIRRWRGRLRAIFWLAIRSPQSALILSIYAVSHTGIATDSVLEELGISYHLGLSPEYRADMSQFEQAHLSGGVKKDFWVRQLYQVSLITKQYKWWEDFFHRRVISNVRKPLARKKPEANTA